MTERKKRPHCQPQLKLGETPPFDIVEVDEETVIYPEQGRQGKVVRPFFADRLWLVPPGKGQQPLRVQIRGLTGCKAREPITLYRDGFWTMEAGTRFGIPGKELHTIHIE